MMAFPIGNPWTKLEDERLLKHVSKMRIKALRKYLPGRSEEAINSRLKRLRQIAIAPPARPKAPSTTQSPSLPSPGLKNLDEQAIQESVLKYLSYEVSAGRMTFEDAAQIVRTLAQYLAKHGPAKLLRGSIQSVVAKLAGGLS